MNHCYRPNLKEFCKKCEYDGTGKKNEPWYWCVNGFALDSNGTPSEFSPKNYVNGGTK